MIKKVLSCLIFFICILTAAYSKPDAELISQLFEEERIHVTYDKKSKDYTITMDKNVFRCRNLKYYEPEECITFGDVRLKFLEGELKLGKKTFSISKKRLEGQFPVSYAVAPKFSIFNHNDLTVKNVDVRNVFGEYEIQLDLVLEIPDGIGGYNKVNGYGSKIISPDMFTCGFYGPLYGSVMLGKIKIWGDYTFDNRTLVFYSPTIEFPEERGLHSAKVRELRYMGNWENLEYAGTITEIFGIPSTILEAPLFTENSVIFAGTIYTPKKDFLPRELQDRRFGFHNLEIGYDGKIHSFEIEKKDTLQITTRDRVAMVLRNLTLELRDDGLHLVTKDNEVYLRDSHTIPFEDIDWNLVTGECNVEL